MIEGTKLRDLNKRAAIDISNKTYYKYTKRVYVKLTLTREYHYIDNRVDKNTHNVSTRAWHPQTSASQ